MPALKTPKMMMDLVKQNTPESNAKLKEMSQQRIWNAMYEFDFGSHNDRGIHGAMPWDILHWMLLNWFKNTRDCFFEQTGDSSRLSKDFDSLCIAMGKLFKRQSDRDMPRVNFSNGVREAMLQANHMPGVLLIMAACFRSTQGRNLLLQNARGPQKTYFSTHLQVTNWGRLVETLLMFHQWLKSDEFSVEAVTRARVKVKEVMSLMKAVGQRQSGMGDKRGGFHGAVHIPEMILDLGAPNGFNVEFNEMDHKPNKKDAKRTQQRESTFDMSVATKVLHRQAVTLAMHEIRTGVKKWHYYRFLRQEEEEQDDEPSDDLLTGTSVTYKFDEAKKEYLPIVNSSSKAKKRAFKYDAQINHFLQYLAGELRRPIECFGELRVYNANLENKSQIYHAEPLNNDMAWYDWGIFQWGDEVGTHEYVLGQMKCFVDLRDLPDDHECDIEPGIYTVVEIATPNPIVEAAIKSQLFNSYIKKPSEYDQFEYLNTPYNKIDFLPIHRLVSPAVVVPDLENDNKRAYLRMVPMWQWGQMFNDWLGTPHRREWG